jgi:SulP family sulfate permease
LRALFPLLRWWPRVGRETLRADAIAGLIGAIIVLPQGVAFATLAGLPPQYGLYAAMVPAVVAALFGSSWHLVSGPTNVISIFVFSSVSVLAMPGSDYYIRLVLTLTFLAGAMQLAMGLARLGTLVNFISHTVIVGFTAGAACLIVTAQLRDFFRLELPRASLPQVWSHFVLHLDTINPYATTVGLATLATAVLSRKLVPRFPYMITAMLAGTGVAFALRAAFGDRAEIATVSAVAAALPPLTLPDLSPEVIQRTLPVAFAVTILALTEAVSIARSIAVKSGQRIDGSQEFIGQGLSNLAASFFSSYASSGSFNRSGLNYEAGARTPRS